MTFKRCVRYKFKVLEFLVLPDLLDRVENESKFWRSVLNSSDRSRSQKNTIGVRARPSLPAGFVPQA